MTKIEWTDHTWNPGIYGCTKVSPACTNCYAERMARRQVAMGNYPSEVVDENGWTGKVVVDYDRIEPSALKLPKKKRARVFPVSMSDLFHRDVPWGFIDEVFRQMEARPHIRFQVLSKRPDRMVAWVERAARLGDDDWPDNVWAGCTVEDQKRADERIPELLEVPAFVHFISAEPLLGPVDLSPWLGLECVHEDAHVEYDTNALVCRECEESNLISWLISGGESGPRARPSHPDWFRSLRDQCESAGVPFHFKGWGMWAPGDAVEANGADWMGIYEQHREDGGAARHWWPDSTTRETAERMGRPIHHGPIAGDTEVLWVGKKAAGRFLDGRTWDRFPEVL